MIVPAAALGLVVQRQLERFPWRRPVTVGFVVAHVVAALTYSLSWFLLSSLVESVFRAQLVLAIGPSVASSVAMGVWLYVMIAGVSYATQATERAARAEAEAARAQLAALRAQLNPHFLFNALHTVVQLIPREPARARHAAEELAGLLRVTVEEDREIVSVAEELAFVQRYLAIERIRFGDRLRVELDVSDDARDAMVPSFAVQTLIENAVRHAAAPRVDATTVSIVGRLRDHQLTLTVRDTGDGASETQLSGNGTGLRRLRSRLAALYGQGARLDIQTAVGSPLAATLVIPQPDDD
jgi:LytS/YehU family sensor histidine kinase